MSEIRETSYYEIALTNRQVMTVFVILLACLVAAFLSGVWIGQRGESVAVETVAAQTITSGIETGEAPLGELRFFSEDDGSPKPGSEAPAGPRRDAVPPAAAGPERAAPKATGPTKPAAQAAPAETTGAPAATPPPPSRTAPPPSPEATPPATPAAAAPAGPAAAAPQRPAAADAEAATRARSLVVIQVFSSSDREQAERVVEQLRTGGLPALLAPVEVSGRTMYRVRIGPYRDPDQAQSVADRVRKEFRLDTWIID